MLISANIFVFIVVVCLLVIGCAFWIQQARTSNWLRRNGKHVIATVTSIEKQPGSSLTYYIVTASWTDPQSNITYIFESDPAPCPPQEQYAAGSPIKVLLDPAHPKRYHMEVG